MQFCAAKRFVKQNLGSLILILITAILITWMGILKAQPIFRILPLYVSLIIGMLQAKANRYASLLGGFNSILYAVVYFSFSLYASAGYAILVSFPFQIATFLRWNKRAYKHSTEFRRMTAKQIVFFSLAFLVSFALLYWATTLAGSNYRLLDNASTLFGIAVSILTLLSFREYTYLMLVSGVLNILLNLVMIKEHPEQITYFIFSVYSLICILRQFFSVRKLYNEQKKGKTL